MKKEITLKNDQPKLNKFNIQVKRILAFILWGSINIIGYAFP